jgi:hypothetical protein
MSLLDSTNWMRRIRHAGILATAVLASAASPRCSAQVVVADPEFATVGFDRWVAEGPRTDIPWKLDVDTQSLTFFQRFLARTEIHVGGDAVFHRAGDGQLLFFVQFTDERGFAFQSHNHVDLAGVQDARAEAMFTQNILAIPGSYRVDFAVFDTSTRERSFAQRTLHIAPLRNDPLPNSWDGADSIEIVPDLPSPDRWFLPRATDKLHLAIDSKSPVNLQIIASGSWSDELSAEKVLSQIDVPHGSSDLALFSYDRRSIFYEQDLAQPLDWPKLKSALATINPNAIDAQALGSRRENLEFFLEEVSRRVTDSRAPAAPAEAAPRALPVFIILAPPWNFRDGEKVHPIRVADDGHSLVFYIRYRSRSTQMNQSSDMSVAGTNSGHPSSVGDILLPGPSSEQSGGTDFLEHTLIPLHPRLFDVTSPEDFRKALATILRDIAKKTQTMKGSE